MELTSGTFPETNELQGLFVLPIHDIDCELSGDNAPATTRHNMAVEVVRGGRRC